MFKRICSIFILVLLTFMLEAVPFIDNITDRSFTVPARAEALTAAAIGGLVGGIITGVGMYFGMDYGLNNESCSSSFSMDVYNNVASVKRLADSLLLNDIPLPALSKVTIPSDVLNDVRDYLINKFNLKFGSAGHTMAHAGVLGYVPGMIFIEGFDLPFYKYDSFGNLNSSDSPLRSDHLATAKYISYAGSLFYENVVSSESAGIVNNIMHRTLENGDYILEALCSRSLTSKGHFASDFFYVYCGNSICAVRRTNGGWSANAYENAFSYKGYNFITGEIGNFTSENSPVWTPCKELIGSGYVDALPISVDEDILFTDDTEDITIYPRDSYIGLTREDILTVPDDITIPGDITVPSEGVAVKDAVIADIFTAASEWVTVNMTVDLPAIMSDVDFPRLFHEHFAPFYDIADAFSAYKDFPSSDHYPVFKIDFSFLNKFGFHFGEYVVLDLGDEHLRNLFSWIREFLRYVLWVCFAYNFIKRFNIHFNVGG